MLAGRLYTGALMYTSLSPDSCLPVSPANWFPRPPFPSSHIGQGLQRATLPQGIPLRTLPLRTRTTASASRCPDLGIIRVALPRTRHTDPPHARTRVRSTASASPGPSAGRPRATPASILAATT
eukprot:176344-Chlamydomonas_euryale.AAC.8